MEFCKLRQRLAFKDDVSDCTFEIKPDNRNSVGVKTHCISKTEGANAHLVVNTLSLWQQQLTAPAESGTLSQELSGGASHSPTKML